MLERGETYRLGLYEIDRICSPELSERLKDDLLDLRIKGDSRPEREVRLDAKEE